MVRALQLAQLIELCSDCSEPGALGLCSAHRSHVVPLLARPLWVRLLGDALVEQRRLQQMEKATESAPAKAHRVRRQLARIAKANARAARRARSSARRSPAQLARIALLTSGPAKAAA